MVRGLAETARRHVFHRILDQHIDDGVEIAAGFFKNLQLLVGGGTSFEHRVDVLDLFSRIQRVNHLINEIKQLADEVLHRNFFLLAEVEQLAVKAVADRPPLVFEDKAAMVDAEPEV